MRGHSITKRIKDGKGIAGLRIKAKCFAVRSALFGKRSAGSNYISIAVKEFPSGLLREIVGGQGEKCLLAIWVSSNDPIRLVITWYIIGKTLVDQVNINRKIIVALCDPCEKVNCSFFSEGKFAAPYDRIHRSA